MDKEKIRSIRERMNAVLAPLATEFGITIHAGNASFSATSVTFKVDIAEIIDGKVQSKQVDDFNKLCHLYGFQPTDLGRKFKVRSEEYEITGLNPRSSKYPIEVKRSDGKPFRFTEDSVRLAMLGKQGE